MYFPICLDPTGYVSERSGESTVMYQIRAQKTHAQLCGLCKGGLDGISSQIYLAAC